MKKILVILGMAGAYALLCWWNMPGETEQQKNWRYIDALIAQSKVHERGRTFCPITGLYTE